MRCPTQQVYLNYFYLISNFEKVKNNLIHLVRFPFSQEVLGRLINVFFQGFIFIGNVHSVFMHGLRRSVVWQGKVTVTLNREAGSIGVRARGGGGDAAPPVAKL